MSLETARARQVVFGPVAGRLGAKPIYEWIEWVGEALWVFHKMAVHDPPGSGLVSLDQLQPGEVVFAPGAIYVLDRSQPVGKPVDCGDKSTDCVSGGVRSQI